MKNAPITEQTIVTWMASRQGKVRKTGPSASLAHGFSAEALKKALWDRGSRKAVAIDTGWIVRKLLDLFRSPAASTGDKIKVLERFQELILLGAIQNPELIEWMGKGPKTKAGIPDPFSGKLRVAK